MIVSFSDLPRETKKYQGHVVRPLYVVLLTTKETMNEFAMATGQIDISFPIWFVMFLPHQGDPLRDFCRSPIGNPFHLMFNTEMLAICYDQPILSEWYALQRNRTIVSSLAEWKPGQKFRPTMNNSLHARRNNLYGEYLRIAYVEQSAFVAVKDGVFTEFLGAVVQELSRSINFTIKVTSSEVLYGNWNEERQAWTGVIGEVVSGMVDIGVAEFSMTSHRMDVVDFTLPLILSRMRVYFRKPDNSSVRWSAYFKAFDLYIWMGVVCIILSAPIILTLMKTKGRFVMTTIGENYINVWGIFCQQGLSEFPHESSLRFAFMSIFVASLVIMSAYSASLISFLTVSTSSLPFSTLEEFAQHGSYKLIVFRNSADYDMLISSNDTVSSKLTRLLKEKEDLPLTVTEGFEQVCSKKVGFYITEAIVNSMGRLPCEIAYIDANRIESLAIVLNKRSPYTGIVNYDVPRVHRVSSCLGYIPSRLQRFKDNGVLNRLRNTFLVTPVSHEKGYPVVTLGSVASILAILAGGMVLACAMLIIEKMYFNLWASKTGESSRSPKLCRKPSGELKTSVKFREKRTVGRSPDG
nr:glutamate receptor ionotropic, delta-2-like isoform X2 [Nomia melanderi]